MSRGADLPFGPTTSRSGQSNGIQLAPHVASRISKERTKALVPIRGSYELFVGKRKIPCQIISVSETQVGGSLYAGYVSRGCLGTECELTRVFWSPVLPFPRATASPLESRSYWGAGSAELNIKICTHKPEHFTESKFYLSCCMLGKPRHKEYALFKATRGACDKARGRIQSFHVMMLYTLDYSFFPNHGWFRATLTPCVVVNGGLF